MELVGECEAVSGNPTYCCSNGATLYVVNEHDDFDGAKTGAVAAFSINAGYRLPPHRHDTAAYMASVPRCIHGLWPRAVVPEGALWGAVIRTGALSPLGSPQSSVGCHPCYIEVSPSGRWLLAANYSEGSVSVLPVSPPATVPHTKTALLPHSNTGTQTTGGGGGRCWRTVGSGRRLTRS